MMMAGCTLNALASCSARLLPISIRSFSSMLMFFALMPDCLANSSCVQPFNSRSILIASPVVTAACFLAGAKSSLFVFIVDLSVFMRGDFQHANGHNRFLDRIDHTVLDIQS